MKRQPQIEPVRMFHARLYGAAHLLQLEHAQDYLRIEKWQAAMAGDTERQWACAKAIDIIICAKLRVREHP